MELTEDYTSIFFVLHSLLIIWGLADCFFGYRIFKLTITILGVVMGAGLGTCLGVWFFDNSLAAPFIGLFLGGVLGGVLSFYIYLIGVFILGFGLGVILAAPFLEQLGGTGFNLLLVLGVLSGIFSIILVKVMVIVATAVTGAFRVVFGAAYLLGGNNLFHAFTDPESLLAMLGESNELFWTMVLTAVAGILVQYRSRKKRLIT